MLRLWVEFCIPLISIPDRETDISRKMRPVNERDGLILSKGSPKAGPLTHKIGKARYLSPPSPRTNMWGSKFQQHPLEHPRCRVRANTNPLLLRLYP